MMLVVKERGWLEMGGPEIPVDCFISRAGADAAFADEDITLLYILTAPRDGVIHGFRRVRVENGLHL